MEYTCNAAVRTIRLRKTSQIEGNCFLQQGQPVSGQAVSKRQLFINGARAAGAGSGQIRVTNQLKVRLGTGVCKILKTYVWRSLFLLTCVKIKVLPSGIKFWDSTKAIIPTFKDISSSIHYQWVPRKHNCQKKPKQTKLHQNLNTEQITSVKCASMLNEAKTNCGAVVHCKFQL